MKTAIQNPLAESEMKSESAWQCVAFNIEIEGAVMFIGGRSGIANLIKVDMERALSERGILLPPKPDAENNGRIKNKSLVLGQLDWFSGVFFVTDLRKGLSTIEAELQRMGFFARCEIGWHWQAELIWRRHHPKTGPDTFQPRLFQWEADSKITSAVTMSLAGILAAAIAPYVSPAPALPSSTPLPPP